MSLQTLYLDLVIAAFAVFGVVLFGVSMWMQTKE
jgi:hypothetical protein